MYIPIYTSTVCAVDVTREPTSLADYSSPSSCSPSERTEEDRNVIYEELLNVRALRHLTNAVSHTSHITHHTSHITHHTLHITHHTSHITHHTSRITHHTLHITHVLSFPLGKETGGSVCETGAPSQSWQILYVF